MDIESSDDCYLHSSNRLIKISWTGLRRYEECNHKHLRTIQGKSSAAADARVFLPGTVADLSMREWLTDPQGSLVDKAEEIFIRLTDREEGNTKDRDFRPIRWKGDETKDRKKVLKKIQKTLENLEPWLITEILPFRYQPELKFRQIVYIPSLTGHPAPILLTGGLDIVKRCDAGDFHGYDLKTTEDKQYYRKTLGQATFYDIAFGHWIGDSNQPKTFTFVFPLLDKMIIPVTVTNDDRMVMMQRIVKMAHGIWRGEWGPKVDDVGCKWCDVHHACDKFKLDLRESAGRNLVSFEDAARRKGPKAETRTSTT